MSVTVPFVSVFYEYYHHYILLLELYSSSLTMRVGAQLDSDLNTLPLKVEGSGLPLRFSVEAITKL